MVFQPFIGISPLRYRDLFEKGKRKDENGKAKKWHSEPRRPMIDVVGQRHLSAEEHIVAELGKIIVTTQDMQPSKQPSL